LCCLGFADYMALRKRSVDGRAKREREVTISQPRRALAIAEK
jgi:hypothetical protein